MMFTIAYIAIIFAFLFALGLAALLLAIPKFLSPKVPSEIKSRPFECGKEPFSLPGGQMPVPMGQGAPPLGHASYLEHRTDAPSLTLAPVVEGLFMRALRLPLGVTLLLGDLL